MNSPSSMVEARSSTATTSPNRLVTPSKITAAIACEAKRGTVFTPRHSPRHRRSCVAKSVALATESDAESARRVRTSGPSSVTATVCSVWAAHAPSAVRTLQPSSSTTVSSVPALTMGSMASTLPDRRRGPVPGGRCCGPPGPRAWPGRCRGRCSPARRRTRRPPRRPGPRRRCRRAGRPSTIASIAAASGGVGHLDQRDAPGAPTVPTGAVKAASPCQPSTMAPQSIDTMSPSSSTMASLGMPCTTTSLGDAQITAG